MVVVLWTFKLVEGVAESEFVDASERVQIEFSHFQPGFVRRTVARGEDGEWLVLVLWGSEEEVDAALLASRADAATQAMSALIDPSTIETKRFQTLD